MATGSDGSSYGTAASAGRATVNVAATRAQVAAKVMAERRIRVFLLGGRGLRR
ncbi:hypothetical protein GCM10009827_051920 [Dactylosporangium maewongense]|uniref:Uncharacterized protein n=1 Tax=Dactylosporangium maewongense TaxID=634393 RepID=A0ABN2AXC2_9ACTN